MSSRGEIPRLAERLRRRLTWSQLAVGTLSVFGIVVGLGCLVQAVGLGPVEPLVGSLEGVTLGLFALAVYLPSCYGLAWVMARGDTALTLRRLPLVLCGGVLIVAISALLGYVVSLISAGGGGGAGGSDGGGSARSSRARQAGLAAAVFDLELAKVALGGELDGPDGGDSPLLRRSSMCASSGPAGHVTMIVVPSDRTGLHADPTAAFPLALARDERWLVRVVAMPADGHEADGAALQALADEALARLSSSSRP